MNRWLAVVTGSMVLVGVWALPPSAATSPPSSTPPERVRLNELEREAARDHAALRALRWADSLSALVVGSDADEILLSPPIVERPEPERVQAWVDGQRAAWSRLARRDPLVRVGIFWVPRAHGTVPGMPLMDSMEDITFVGSRDGVPYCVRALPYTDRIAFISPLSSDLGACRIFAKYGMPGEQIHAWLEASSLGFARVPIPTFAAEYARMVLQPVSSGVRLFGRDRPRLAEENLASRACLARRPPACARALTDSELLAAGSADAGSLADLAPLVARSSYRAQPPFGLLDDALVYEWEAAFGPDAFARFWSSDEPVPEAFESAFGEPLGAWMLDWADRHIGTYRAGPSLPWSSVWTSVLALAALAVVATAAGVRRRLG